MVSLKLSKSMPVDHLHRQQRPILITQPSIQPLQQSHPHGRPHAQAVSVVKVCENAARGVKRRGDECDTDKASKNRVNDVTTKEEESAI